MHPRLNSDGHRALLRLVQHVIDVSQQCFPVAQPWVSTILLVAQQLGFVVPADSLNESGVRRAVVVIKFLQDLDDYIWVGLPHARSHELLSSLFGDFWCMTAQISWRILGDVELARPDQLFRFRERETVDGADESYDCSCRFGAQRVQMDFLDRPAVLTHDVSVSIMTLGAHVSALLLTLLNFRRLQRLSKYPFTWERMFLWTLTSRPSGSSRVKSDQVAWLYRLDI